MRNATFLIFLIFGLFSCKAGKKLNRTTVSIDHQKAVEESLVNLVSCINDRLIDCVDRYYAEDYRGIVPLVEFDSKKALVASIIDNYTKNDYKIKIRIEEIEARDNMAFALVEWQIYVPKKIENEIIFQQHCMKIWEKNNEIWQLKRSLFYSPSQ